MRDPMASQSAAANPSTSSKRLLPWLVAVAFFMESIYPNQWMVYVSLSIFLLLFLQSLRGDRHQFLVG
jgi:hypothetical protein